MRYFIPTCDKHSLNMLDCNWPKVGIELLKNLISVYYSLFPYILLQ